MGAEGHKTFEYTGLTCPGYRDMTVGKVYTVDRCDPDCFVFNDDAGDMRVWDYDSKDVRWITAPSTTTLTEFPTGALRESKADKGRPDLLLAGFPRALLALSKHMDCPLGRERNWEKGLPESSLVASQFRHLTGYASGVSEDTPEYNLTAALWNAMVLLETYLRVQDGVMPSTLLDIAKGTTDGETD